MFNKRNVHFELMNPLPRFCYFNCNFDYRRFMFDGCAIYNFEYRRFMFMFMIDL